MTKLRDWIALALIQEECDGYSLEQLNKDKVSEHHGDCTNEPFSCLRCIADEMYERADTIIQHRIRR